MITKFKLYCEKVKFSNVSKIKGSGELYKKLKDYTNINFNKDEPIISEVFMEKYDTIVKILWQHDEEQIIRRLKNRTEINSISELNELVNKIVKEIIPSKIGSYIYKSATYDIYLKNRRLHFLIYINYKKLFETPELRIVSIIKGTIGNLLTIEIDD